ncbi:MAG: diacylglycerol kinase family protein [Candidatus Magasanikbacteria bacterium]
MNLKKFFKSFVHAGRGLRHAWMKEQNFRIKFLTGIAVFVLMYYIDVTFYEEIILTLLVFLVLSLELVNTSIEHLSDLVESKINKKVKVVKDLAAGSVLLISIVAAVIALFIFYPHFVG